MGVFMRDTSSLMLFNSLTRQLEPFQPVHAGEARVYSCGPTVYNFPHIGNMRAYVFADTLGRTLSAQGYALTHVINITDVGHLTDDADAGEDKLEKAARSSSQTIWDIAKFYTDAYWDDIRRLNIREPAHWSIATDYVPQMIDFASKIAAEHCYELDSGLYFDVTSVPDYGRLARSVSDEGESRIDPVDGKRHPADFAIWRKTPAGETRQMEWDSPWGKGAPGWHLECSVMSGALLGFPFDIHTGGIDHREIHHPNEIAQNQAITHAGGLDCSDHSGARMWMHNNFLVDRTGKMSKSSGEFLRLQLLIDKGYHPLAYRLMCLQAHYRSELEFSWDALGAALTRLKRMVMAIDSLKSRLNDLGAPPAGGSPTHPKIVEIVERFHAAMQDDLNTPIALTALDDMIALKKVDLVEKMGAIATMDAVLGLNLLSTERVDLRLQPKGATITKDDIDNALIRRKTARVDKDFATSDAIRDALIAAGVDVMDGDPMGWEWKLGG